MSEIKALDELRGLRDEAASKMVDNPKWVCKRAEEIADRIEAEIAERYMELPVGADDLPIRVGDELEGGFTVDYVAPHWVLAAGRGARHEDNCRHVKPRTLEDVLRDVWKEALDYAKSDMWRNPDKVFAERADEIRELMGGKE